MGGRKSSFQSSLSAVWSQFVTISTSRGADDAVSDDDDAVERVTGIRPRRDGCTAVVAVVIGVVAVAGFSTVVVVYRAQAPGVAALAETPTLCDTLWSHCDLGRTKVTV